MAVLPNDPFGLADAVAVESEPGLTWYLNGERIDGTVDNLAAVRQAAEIILNTDRYRWQIYSPMSGVEYDNLIGLDAGYVAAELQRRIRDALIMDDRITGISDFLWTQSGDRLTVSFTVNTVYGPTTEEMEVTLA